SPPPIYTLSLHDALPISGWTGGAYGVGTRMKLLNTRAMIHAVLHGDLHSAPLTTDPIFGLQVPKHIAGVPDEVLNPRNTWKDKEIGRASCRERVETGAGG